METLLLICILAFPIGGNYLYRKWIDYNADKNSMDSASYTKKQMGLAFLMLFVMLFGCFFVLIHMSETEDFLPFVFIILMMTAVPLCLIIIEFRKVKKWFENKKQYSGTEKLMHETGAMPPALIILWFFACIYIPAIIVSPPIIHLVPKLESLWNDRVEVFIFAFIISGIALMVLTFRPLGRMYAKHCISKIGDPDRIFAEMDMHGETVFQDGERTLRISPNYVMLCSRGEGFNIWRRAGLRCREKALQMKRVYTLKLQVDGKKKNLSFSTYNCDIQRANTIASAIYSACGGPD